MSNEKPRRTVPSLVKALNLLEMVVAEESGASLKEISAKAGLHGSNVHTILGTFIETGYLYQDPDSKRYHANLKLLELGKAVESRLDVRARALPYMREVSTAFGEAVFLAVRHDWNALIVETIPGIHTVTVNASAITRDPLHATGLGKVLLSELEQSAIDQFIAQKGLPKFTAHTITSKSALQTALSRVRAQGYATESEESGYGSRCVAVGVRDAGRHHVAAISVAAPLTRMTDDRLAEIAAFLQEVCGRLSAELGWRPNGN